MASSKEDATGRDWLPKKELQGLGATPVGGERGSAFAKYVRKDVSSSQLRTEDILQPESKSNSDEPETVAVDSQPSVTTFNKISVKQHHSQQQSRPESSGRSEDDADCDEDDDTSSSDSDNTHSKGNNGKHSKKRYRSADSDHKPKKQRLIWTPELHARFLAAVNHLGVKNAVPKTILQLMNVEGMTRENVASHLQKYRLYLKRLAGLPPNVPLSADTLQQVQTVQQALQQQVQAGFQTSHTLQLAAGGVPLSLAGIPAVSLAGNYQDLVSQLMAANAATSAASSSGSGAAAGLAGAELQAGTLAALQRSQLVGAVGVLPGILPIGFTPLSMTGFGGLNSAALLGGAAGGIGMVSPVSLANSGLVLQGGNVLAAAQLGNGNTTSQ